METMEILLRQRKNHGILCYWEKLLRQRQNQEGNQLIDRDRGGQWSSHSTTYNRHKINIIDKNVMKETKKVLMCRNIIDKNVMNTNKNVFD